MNELYPVFILSELIVLPSQELKIDISNEASKKVIKASSKNNLNKVLIVSSKDLDSSTTLDLLPSVGVVALVKSKIELSSGNLRVVLRGIKRVNIDKYFQNQNTNVLKCNIKDVILPEVKKDKEVAYIRKAKDLLKKFISLNKNVSNSILTSIENVDDLNIITDMITSFMPFNFVKKLDYLQTINPVKRIEMLINDLDFEISVSKVDKEIDDKLSSNLEKSQRDFVLREKLKEINSELGITLESKANELREKISLIDASENTKVKLNKEVDKYLNSSEYSPESSVIKNYIDTVLSLPWNEESLEIVDSKSILNELNKNHYGLKEIKDRIVEYSYIKKKNPFISSPIMCFVGFPGVGKTSIASSIAKALNRKFYKMSVGGLNDSLELVGSRRTYLGAMPGKIIQGLIKCGTKNPVILIDEVDKMVKDYKGDPASVLLEILDEAQNKYFTDNYIEEAFDLSKVMFILTANNKENIPSVLLDRMEIYDISSYTLNDKTIIANKYLLPEIYNNLNVSFKISTKTLEYIIVNYTKEPGVRELKKVLERLVRKVFVYEDNKKEITVSLVDKYLINKNLLSVPKIENSGIVNLLAYTLSGGMISRVESLYIKKGSGNVTITGNVGSSLKESIEIVKSYLYSNYNVDYSSSDLHINFMGSIKKDGPSAGVGVAVSLLSLYKNKKISDDVAFTGELMLSGDILPVGGIKEKISIARLNGIKTIYIPKLNSNDIDMLDESLLDGITVKKVDNFRQIYEDFMSNML